MSAFFLTMSIFLKIFPHFLKYVDVLFIGFRRFVMGIESEPHFGEPFAQRHSNKFTEERKEGPPRRIVALKTASFWTASFFWAAVVLFLREEHHAPQHLLRLFAPLSLPRHTSGERQARAIPGKLSIKANGKLSIKEELLL